VRSPRRSSEPLERLPDAHLGPGAGHRWRSGSNDPTGRDLTLERELAEVFGLRDVRVADVAPPDRALSRVGDLGARWLMRISADGARVAVSWGTTMQALVAAVPAEAGQTQDLGDIEVVPLVGGLSSVEASITGEELVRDLAGRLGGRMRRLHAPAILTSAETRDVLPRRAQYLRDPGHRAGGRTSRWWASVASGSASSAAIVEAVAPGRAERKAFRPGGTGGRHVRPLLRRRRPRGTRFRWTTG